MGTNVSVMAPEPSGRGGSPPRTPRTLKSGGWRPNFRSSPIAVVLALVVVYFAYFWCVRRVVVHPGEVLVLIKKDGSRSLPADQIIIPRPPDAAKDRAGYDKWEKEYGNCNGILEQVYLPGTYFGYSPFDYERIIIPVGNADVPQKTVGVVVRKFGAPLDPGQIIADESRAQRGPLPNLLWPGTYYEYANPYAYEIKHVDPISVDPGHRGVVALMTGAPPTDPNEYLVKTGELGMQAQTEPEGFVYVNPYQKRIVPISIQSQRFEMSGNDEIHFPSSDSFDIKLDGFVEWSIDPR